MNHKCFLAGNPKTTSTKLGKNMKQQVTDFLIWRTASAVGWDCSVKDLAAEVGFSLTMVRDTLKRRGWKNRFPEGRETGGYLSRPSVDVLMSGKQLRME